MEKEHCRAVRSKSPLAQASPWVWTQSSPIGSAISWKPPGTVEPIQAGILAGKDSNLDANFGVLLAVSVAGVFPYTDRCKAWPSARSCFSLLCLAGWYAPGAPGKGTQPLEWSLAFVFLNIQRLGTWLPSAGTLQQVPAKCRGIVDWKLMAEWIRNDLSLSAKRWQCIASQATDRLAGIEPGDC